MHLAINAQLLSPAGGYRQAGVSTYIERLLTALLAATPGERWTVYAAPGVDRARIGATATTTLHTSRLPTTKPVVRIAWEQVAAPALLARDRPNVLLCPLNVVPLLAPCPTVVTIHDLAFLRVPEHFRPAKRRYLAALTRWSVRRAAHVLTVSEWTRQEVIALLGVAPSKVTAVPNGRDPALQPPDPAAVAAFRARAGLPDQFLLYVGTLEPRKNLLALIHAYAAVREEIKMPLVLAGGKGWLYEPIFDLVSELGLADWVRFPGFVAPADLPLWYGAATAFVYLSVYEGFGLPPLEAMQFGTPVLTASTTSLPEVVGDAALTVDPHSVPAISAALQRLASDATLRADLRRRGLARAQQFSWDAAAAATLRVLRAAGAGRAV